MLVALLLLAYGCLATVRQYRVTLPHGAVGWSAVCDCIFS